MRVTCGAAGELWTLILDSWREVLQVVMGVTCGAAGELWTLILDSWREDSYR
ncbi:hypothetical protein LEMLEM_LOCUS15436, partial [Lemmus lemmus]